MARHPETVTIISYNLLMHKAADELEDVAINYNPDVLCVQEADVEQLPKVLGKLTLIACTTFGKEGLGMYVCEDNFDVLSVDRPEIHPSVLERLLRVEQQRLLVTRLKDKTSGHEFMVGDFHATHLIATNFHRREQIRRSLDAIKNTAEDKPIVVVGDFNYPFFISGLHGLTEEHGFNLERPGDVTYKSVLFKGEFDFAVHRGFAESKLEVLPFSMSDHAPIRVTCTFN